MFSQNCLRVIGVRTVGIAAVFASLASIATTAFAVDTVPDPFVFNSTKSSANTIQTSNIVTITGIDAPSPISVAGGSYRINSGSYVSTAGSISPGSTVTMRVIGSPTPGGAVTTGTLTIGGVSAAFNVITTGGTDSTPDAFPLGTVSGAAASSVQTSDAVVITGINTAAKVSIAGGTYRIGAGAYTSAAGELNYGDTVSVRVTAPATAGATASATLTIGGVSSAFRVTTTSSGGSDTTPDPFSFASVTNAVPGSVQTSNAVTILGIDSAAAISVSGGSYSIDGGSFTSAAGTIGNGSSVVLRVTASSTAGATTGAVLSIGGVDGNFSVTTAAAGSDTTPNAFSFSSVSSASAGSTQTSNAVTIGGINAAAPISITGGSYNINGGSYTSASGSVNNGDSVTVRVTASSTAGASITATLTVGGISGSFKVTTASSSSGGSDSSPDSFLIKYTYVPRIDNYEEAKGFYYLPGTAVTTQPFNVSGINKPANISVTKGYYSINDGPFTAAPGTVVNGDKVVVQVIASSSYNTAVTASLKIDTLSKDVVVTTTLASSATPTAISGTEVYIYKNLSPVPLRLFVTKPSGWKSTDRRPAMFWYFGGGWTSGDPNSAVSWTKWAADQGMVGIAPDYRTSQRFGTTPLESVDDARAALRWIQDHAASLGIDSTRIAMGGSSAGGHVGLWDSIVQSPPGSESTTAPLAQPKALVLNAAVSDVTPGIGYAPARFGSYANALSPVYQLSPWMPPTLAFHCDADPTVPYQQSVNLCKAYTAQGSSCQLVTVSGSCHGVPDSFKDQARTMILQFLNDNGVLPP